MGDLGQSGGPLADGASGQVCRPVFGDDDPGVVAGGGDDRTLGQHRDDPGAGHSVGHGGGTQADERVVVEAHLGTGDEVFVAADPRDLPPFDVVRHDLTVKVDAEGAVDRDEGVVLGDHRRIVDHLDRHEGHFGVAIEPGIELSRSEGEGGDRDSVEQVLGIVGDLAGLMEQHQPVREHFRVDAVPAAGAVGQLGRHHVRYGSDPDLERGPVGDERPGDVGDGFVDVVGCGRRKGERSGIGLDQHVDQVERNGVGELRWHGVGAGQVGVHLDHEETVRVPSGQQQLVVGGADVQGEVDGAVVIGRGGEDGHDARVVPAQDGSELAEAAGHQLDVRPALPQDPLGWSEEPAPIRDVLMGQHGVEPEQQGTAEGEVDPVVPPAECGQEGVRIGWPEAHADGVGSGDACRRLLWCAGPRCHGASVAPCSPAGEGTWSQICSSAPRWPTTEVSNGLSAPTTTPSLVGGIMGR